MNWPFRKSNPGRELGELAALKRKREALSHQELKFAVARQIRRETGQPPSPVLETCWSKDRA